MQPVQTTDNSQCDSQSSEVLKESRKDSGKLIYYFIMFDIKIIIFNLLFPSYVILLT